jgi:hypothetical protein
MVLHTAVILLALLQPHLPSANTVSGIGVLRLWAGNEHGFAMAPCHLHYITIFCNKLHCNAS